MATPIDLAVRQQVYLERLKSGYIKNWAGVQKNLRARIRAVLTALEIDNLQELNRRQLLKVLQELRDAATSVTAPAMTEFMSQMPGLAGMTVALETTGIDSLMANPPRWNIPTAFDAYQAALENPLQATGQLLGDFVGNWPELDALRVSNVVQKGWGQGRSLMDMVKEVVGTPAEGYADGALKLTADNAGAVIATATQHIANAARMETWERNSDIVNKYQWVSVLDRRTTQQCKSLDGRQFEPGKGPMPPIHIRCRSTTVGVFNDEFKFLDEGATRASGGPNPGYVPADDNYYDWLKGQPSDFQDVAIGPTRAKLFRDGGLSADRFAELNLGRDFEPLTLAQMREIEPEAFEKAGLITKEP